MKDRAGEVVCRAVDHDVGLAAAQGLSRAGAAA